MHIIGDWKLGHNKSTTGQKTTLKRSFIIKWVPSFVLGKLIWWNKSLIAECNAINKIWAVMEIARTEPYMIYTVTHFVRKMSPRVQIHSFRNIIYDYWSTDRVVKISFMGTTFFSKKNHQAYQQTVFCWLKYSWKNVPTQWEWYVMGPIRIEKQEHTHPPTHPDTHTHTPNVM